MQKMMLIKLLHKVARPEIVDWDNDFSTMVQFCSHRILDDLKNGLDAFETITDYFHPIFVQKTDDMQTLQKKLLFFQQQLASMQPTDADYNDTTAKIAALQISIANTNDTERLRYIFNDTCGHTLNPPARTLFEDISILFPNFKSLSVKYPQMQAFAITWQKNTAMDRFQICQVKIPNVEISAGMGQNWNVIRCQLEHEINRKFNVHVQSDNTTTIYNPS
jgi:hypothetical protein